MSGLIAVVLAAGKGTRMKSRTPKVLHDLCGVPMIEHVLSSVRALEPSEIIVVINRELEGRLGDGVTCVIQEPQGGTGHAVQVALASARPNGAAVFVAAADMPLVGADLMREVVDARSRADTALSLLTARVDLPSPFGRVIRHDGRFVRIVEVADASPAERGIDEVNAGVYCFAPDVLRRFLASLKPNNAQGELYLTDCVGAAIAAGDTVTTVQAADPRSVLGVNTRAELALARAEMQRRILERHMLDGVTVVDPAATWIDAGVRIGADTVVMPGTHLQGSTQIGAACVIGPNSVLVDARIDDEAVILCSVVATSHVEQGATIGPFAHLRGGTVVATGAHVGNFVEMKNTRFGRGAKAGHLSYLGDAEVGEKANIGAGTITCNFDGKRKHRTRIGAEAFVGSNTSLVAPVEIGDRGLTGAGSVVLEDVGPGERVVGNPARRIQKKD